MELVVLTGALVLVVGLVAATASRRPPTPPPAAATTTRTPPAAPPTFKVVALGLAGSGKTVLLASMFHQLNYATPHRSYFLDARPEQRIALNRIYKEVCDTEQGWPRATRVSECTEYLFDCIAVDDERQRHHILTIRYLDYAGELLEAEQECGQGAFGALVENIDSAHALLGVLDGQRILQLLRGEEAGRRHLEYDVRTMLGLLQSADAPVHLVISKWDLVRGFGEPDHADDQLRLQYVINALMAFDHFRALTDFRPERVVRLIPVSAVGPGFAEIGTNGVVRKRPGADLHPRNVDVPLSAVVPDLFRQVERSLDDEARARIDESVRCTGPVRLREALSGVAAFFNRGAGTVVRTVLVGAVGGEVANEVGRMFVEWAARPYETMAGKLAAERSMREAELDRFRGARALVLAQFETAVRRLEAGMPNSELGRR